MFYPSKVGDVTVKRNTLVSCASLKIHDDNSFHPSASSVHLTHSHADAKDGIGAQLVLVVSAIKGQLKEAKLVKNEPVKKNSG